VTEALGQIEINSVQHCSEFVGPNSAAGVSDPGLRHVFTRAGVVVPVSSPLSGHRARGSLHGGKGQGPTPPTTGVQVVAEKLLVSAPIYRLCLWLPCSTNHRLGERADRCGLVSCSIRSCLNGFYSVIIYSETNVLCRNQKVCAEKKSL
jgi:hypothetical protein